MHTGITDTNRTNKKKFAYTIEIIDGSTENPLIIVKF